MSYKIPEKVGSIPPYKPAEGNYRVRLNANESFIPLPDGLRKKVAEAVASVDMNRYPDPWATEVCALAAGLFGVPAQCVVAGNGSDELISVLINGFCSRNSVILVSEPDFDMYRFYSDTSEIHCIPLNKKDRRVDVDAIIQSANENNADMVIFSNPCNPTGMGITADEAARLVSSVKGLVVLDEAYMDFWDQSLLGRICEFDNLLILKTCSKAFGLAAFRLGFAVGPKEIVDGIKKVKSPFNVNSLTQAAASVVLSDAGYLKDACEKIKVSRDMLQAAVEEMALKYPGKMTALKTVTNFVLMSMSNADFVFGELIKRGIIVRKIMGNYLRVTAGSEWENREFLSALDQILSESGE